MSLEKVPNFIADFLQPEMNSGESRIYRFHSFLLDVAERQLFDGDLRIALTPKTFDALVYLVENGGHLVEKDELLNAVWPDSFVAEVNIPRTIFALRKALGQDGNGNKFIETVPTKGYRFVAEVHGTDANGRGGRALNGEVERNLPGSGLSVKCPSAGQEHGSRTWDDSGRPKALVLTVGVVILLVITTGGLLFSWSAKGGDVRTKSVEERSENGAAYQAYRQGRLLVTRMRPGDLQEARAQFEKAIELDPNYAAAHAGKAYTMVWIFWASGTHDDISQARRSLQKALEIKPDSSYAHTALCRIKATYDWDFAGAEKECRRAIELDPGNHEAHHELAMLQMAMGRFDEAHAAIDAAAALEPISIYKRQKSLIYFFGRRFPEAIEQIERVNASDPEYRHAQHWLLWAYAMNREYDKAFEVYLEIEQKEHPELSISDLRGVYVANGWLGFMRQMHDMPHGQKHWPNIAARLCQIGDKEKVFAALEKGFVDRKLFMPSLAQDPRFDPCRDDPRFDSLVNRVGLK